MERARGTDRPRDVAETGRSSTSHRQPSGGYPTVVGRAVFGRDRTIELVYLDGYSGPMEAVAATLGVAALSFLTGLAHLTGDQVVAGGLVTQYATPGFAELLGLTNVLFGFVLLGVTGGLHYRFRPAFRLAVALLALVAFLSIVALNTVTVPLALASVVVLGVLVSNRQAFDRHVHPSTVQIGASVAIVAVLVYGTVGTFALREQFSGIQSLVDAFYFVVVAGATGGGSAEPVSVRAKLFTLSVLLVGTASFTAAIGAVVVPVVESRLSEALGPMTPSRHELLEDHVVVLGAGSLTDAVLAELGDDDVVVLTRDPGGVSNPDERAVTVVEGDPTDEAALRSASVESASAILAASDDDAGDALALLAATELTDDCSVVAAATEPANVRRLEAAGAETVLSPTLLAGRLLGRAVHGEELPPADSSGEDDAE